MCQPGRPRPHGESHHVSSSGLFPFQRVRLLLLDLVGTLARELSVVRIPGNAEVDVAVDRVRVAALDQLLDEPDDLVDGLGRLRQRVGPAEPERVGVLEVPLRRARRHDVAAFAQLGSRLIDLVIDVSDVVDERRVVAALAQPRSQPHPDHERTRVADVRARVDGRPAEVHANRAGGIRQLDESARQRVIEPHRPSAAAPRAGERPRRPRARAPAPGPSARRAASEGRRPPPSARGRSRARRGCRSRARRAP